MPPRSKTYYLGLILTAAMILCLTAGSAQAYYMAVYQESYSCRASASSTLYLDWEGPPPFPTHQSDSMTGEFSASASVPGFGLGGSNAHASTTKVLLSSNEVGLRFSVSGESGSFDTEIQAHASSYVRGRLEFTVFKPGAGEGEIVYVPFELEHMGSAMYVMNIDLKLTINNTSWHWDFSSGQDNIVSEIPFPVGVRSILTYDYHGGTTQSNHGQDYDGDGTLRFFIEGRRVVEGAEVVPIPGSLMLLGSGLGLLVLSRRRQR